MRVLAVITLVACGGGSNKPPIDSPPKPIDSSIDSGPIPTTITITGVVNAVSASGTTALSGVTVGAYSVTNETTPIITATSDAQGNYTLTFTTNGQALDGYLKATVASYMDTYLYPQDPLAANFTGATIAMLTPGTFGFVGGLCTGNQMSANGTILAGVFDGSGAGIAGASIASTPAASSYCYFASGVPSAGATSTDSTGLGFMFNVTGTASVSATKSGLTFQTHSLKVRPAVLTFTLITP
jgi:hypothetical protein